MQNVIFVKAEFGKQKIHIQNPIAINRITICRFSEKFILSDYQRFQINPCKICLKNYDDFVKFKFIKNNKWLKC